MQGPAIFRRLSGSLFWGIAALLLAGIGIARAELREADYLAGRLDSLRQQQQQGSVTERLFVGSLTNTNADESLLDCRRVLTMPAANWIQREALRRLLDSFCIQNQVDSLRAYRAQYRRLAGKDYSCDGVPDRRNSWVLQVGAFSSLDNARRSVAKLDQAGISVRILREGSLYRALAGGWNTKKEARRQGALWQKQGLLQDYSPRKVSQ